MYDTISAHKKGPRYVVYIFLYVISLVMTLAWCLVLYHFHFKISYALPFTAPGTMTSQLEGPVYWSLLAIVLTRLGTLIASTSRVTDPKNNGAKYCLYFIALANAIAEVAAMVILFIERASCNRSPQNIPSGANNQCNDYRWCSVYGPVNQTLQYFENTTIVNYCPTVLASPNPPVTADDLRDNWVFLYYFASTFFFLAAAVLHLFISYWMGDGSEAAPFYSTSGNDDMYEDQYTVESSINRVASSGGNKKRVKGN